MATIDSEQAKKIGFQKRKKLYLKTKDKEQALTNLESVKAEMGAIQQQMVEAKKNERPNALKEVKHLCKEFGFTARMLKGALAEGRKNNEHLRN